MNKEKDIKKRIRELTELQGQLIRQIDVLSEFVNEQDEDMNDLDVRVNKHKVFKPCFKVSIPVERFI